MEEFVNISDIKNLYPNEWVLIGNPIKTEDGVDFIAAIPIFHSKDKKEVCYIGREKTKGFDKISLIYTGNSNLIRKLTALNVIKKRALNIY